MTTLLKDDRWAAGPGSRLLQVGLATFAILALELALIRWISGQVRVLAYFNNLILIACFLGMGLGVVVGRRRAGLVHLALPVLLVVCVPFAFASELGLMHLPFPDPAVHLWGAEIAHASPGAFFKAYAIIVALFSGVGAVFFCAGGAVGHLLSLQGDLKAYSADLLGSLLGIAAITVVTVLELSPPWWLGIGGAALLFLSRKWFGAVALVGTLALAQFSVGQAVFSPYNRIDVAHEDGGLLLEVNRDFHQYIFDFSEAAMAREAAGPRAEFRTLARKMYDIPWIVSDAKARGVIVGAGTGNDVQAALRNGFQQVVSVDIDGRIMAIGRALHPEHPYADPRTIPVNDDGRAFFEQYAGPKFDVVCFGFVDSHAMFSTLSSLRLDNFLYTEEGLRAAWRHVGPDGHLTVALSFIGGEWLKDRLYWTLYRATGVAPIRVDHGLHGGGTFVVARDPKTLHLDRIAEFPIGEPGSTEDRVVTTSDDWPFLYMRPSTVPWAYLMILVTVLVLALASSGAAFGVRNLAAEFDAPLFFMGAAFLLVETRAVTSLSILFGSTWIVNTAVFSGVLLMALLANQLVQRRTMPNTLVLFGALFLSVFVIFFTDNALLNQFPLVVRGLLGGVINGLPVGIAGIIVSTLLLRAKSLGGALASNLLGSVLGGCLEYLSMYVGLRALAMLALTLYLVAFVLVRFRRAPVVA